MERLLFVPYFLPFFVSDFLCQIFLLQFQLFVTFFFTTLVSSPCLFQVVGGALKRTVEAAGSGSSSSSSSRWAHVACALWNPAIRIRNLSRMEPIEAFDAALRYQQDRLRQAQVRMQTLVIV